MCSTKQNCFAIGKFCCWRARCTKHWNQYWANFVLHNLVCFIIHWFLILLCFFLLRLLSKNRKYIEIHSDENDNIWEYHEASEILETVAVLGDRSIFPMLSALRLHGEKYDQIQALLLHCEELHKLRQMYVFFFYHHFDLFRPFNYIFSFQGCCLKTCHLSFV